MQQEPKDQPEEGASSWKAADTVKASNPNLEWKPELEWDPVWGKNAGCFYYEKAGHFTRECLARPQHPYGAKPHAFVHVVQTTVSEEEEVDSGNKSDVDDDKAEHLNIQETKTKKASREEDNSDNEYVEVDIYDVYNNNYYVWESNTKFIGALTDYLASKIDNSIEAANVKVYKVHLWKAPEKLARPVPRREDKECLALYVEVNGHKAWAL